MELDLPAGSAREHASDEVVIAIAQRIERSQKLSLALQLAYEKYLRTGAPKDKAAYLTALSVNRSR